VINTIGNWCTRNTSRDAPTPSTSHSHQQDIGYRRSGHRQRDFAARPLACDLVFALI
jgi:hypothetical protein